MYDKCLEGRAADCFLITLTDAAFIVALITCECRCLFIDRSSYTLTSLWRTVTSAGRWVTRIPAERPGRPIKTQEEEKKQDSDQLRDDCYQTELLLLLLTHGDTDDNQLHKHTVSRFVELMV